MKKTLLVVGIVLAGTIVLILALLPQILTLMGFHPDFEREEFNLEGKRALIIATNHDTLGDPEDGVATGVFSSELTIGYYEFLDAGMTVDIASIEGGVVPFDPISLRWPLAAHADRRFLNDEDAQYKTQNSLSIENVDFTDYDIIWMSGGWGAAYDLGFSQVLGDKISEAHAEGILLGSVCHGALGFILATDVDGRPLVEGRTMTAVTDKQVEELGIEITPQHPETELRRLNANFVSDTAFRDFFATYVAVDGNIVTGQNQNSSGETAQTLLRMLAEESE
ncbi:MAG: type 1 glutamine amidotransferase domain-containing protein [Chloroflexi bacterium]|nr:type 1 glutamine amidotransferase domain-containing protein [Chloroflexota bacterium]